MPQDKLAKPAFAGESQTDRVARAALHAVPLICNDTCQYAEIHEHSTDCPRFVPLKQPSDDLPF